MSVEVRYARLAAEDMRAIRRWITREADRETADRYLERVRVRCRRLADVPLGGTPRDELSAGVRSIGFERRLIIFYRVEDASVLILRIVHGARELEPLLGG